tara:strand:- start:64 stop:174 length:111 start_codon:yes stop_codon:yes gene_type:complete
MKSGMIHRLKKILASTAILVTLGAVIKYVIDRRYPI